MIPPQPQGKYRLKPGQTLIFIGDHTTPDAPGYILVIRDVLARFYPDLNLRLISAGSRGQTPAGVASKAMMELLGSSRPDYVVIGVGLTDAAREPVAARLLEEYRKRLEERDEGLDETFGPEHRAHFPGNRTVEDSGRAPQIELQRLPRFTQDLADAMSGLTGAGIGTILMTPALAGNELDYPLNPILLAYARAIRALGTQNEVHVVDVEQAFRNMFDRAANYKQKAILSGSEGRLNAQGQTLIARTFLGTFGLLPGAGNRPATP